MPCIRPTATCYFWMNRTRPYVRIRTLRAQKLRRLLASEPDPEEANVEKEQTMKSLKTLGLALGIVLALGAFVADTALAENAFLPESVAANPVKFTVKSGAVSFSAAEGVVIECSSDAGSGEVTSQRLGSFEITPKGCTTLGGFVKCSALTKVDSTGEIPMMGEFHMRMGLTGQPLGLILFLILHVHQLCGPELVLLLGCIAGSITPLNTLSSTATVSLKTVKAGENEITTADNEAETAMEGCKLTMERSGKTEEGGMSNIETLEKPEQGGKAVTVLVMV
jgi:hypothetical protein